VLGIDLKGKKPQCALVLSNEDRNSSSYLVICPPGIDLKNPLIGGFLAAEWDDRKKSRVPIDFVLYIKKDDKMPTPPNMEFNDRGQMRIELKKGEKGDFAKLIQRPLGDLYIRSAEGLRSLVTVQAANEIAAKIRDSYGNDRRG
jgi:hypothetical protein